ncbi:MAG TPA: 3-deoxy-8-phosphooctulonate synthase [Candidatus Binatia bacterium]|jgi:2-dehydro-3-deoxyphosphooctonate aldolase (KDO 8-P synthase)
MANRKTVKIGGFEIGGGKQLALIAGPCVIESADSALRHASALKQIADRAAVPFVFKSSYDKANRTSLESFRGPGIDEGLKILSKVRREIGVPVLTDVHEIDQIAAAAEAVDVLQIPAFLCRQTDFVLAVARAGKAVNIKKGQFLAPWDVKNIVEKVVSTGNEQVTVTERGASFGYNNLVSDMRSLVVLGDIGYPVVFDATHSLQQPGGLGKASGGERRYIPALARAAAAVGIDALFMEVHEDPDRALSDGPNSLALADLEGLLKRVKEIDALVKQR